MEKIRFGFSSDRKTFDIDFLMDDRYFSIPHKELLIQVLFHFIQARKISHQIKEKILIEGLLDPYFPEVLNNLSPMDTMHKMSFMVDLNMYNILNPTIEMAEDNSFVPYAYLVEEIKETGRRKIFPFFRFKDEGINLIRYLHAIQKISYNDLMVMKIQISRLNLPMSYLETYIRKTLNPALTP